MGFASRGISAPDILAALTTDSVKFAGAKVDSLAMVDFFSNPNNGAITVNNVAGTETLPDVIIPNITGKTIEAAYAILHPVNVMCTAANYVDGDQKIQVNKAAAGWIDALDLEHGEFDIRDANITRYPAPIVGHRDITTRVAFNSTINFQWLSAKVAAANFYIYGCRTGVRLILS